MSKIIRIEDMKKAREELERKGRSRANLDRAGLLFDQNIEISRFADEAKTLRDEIKEQRLAESKKLNEGENIEKTIGKSNRGGGVSIKEYWDYVLANINTSPIHKNVVLELHKDLADSVERGELIKNMEREIQGKLEKYCYINDYLRNWNPTDEIDIFNFMMFYHYSKNVSKWVNKRVKTPVCELPTIGRSDVERIKCFLYGEGALFRVEKKKNQEYKNRVMNKGE